MLNFAHGGSLKKILTWFFILYSFLLHFYFHSAFCLLLVLSKPCCLEHKDIYICGL